MMSMIQHLDDRLPTSSGRLRTVGDFPEMEMEMTVTHCDVAQKRRDKQQ